MAGNCNFGIRVIADEQSSFIGKAFPKANKSGKGRVK
jgi:hypothetical protein